MMDGDISIFMIASQVTGVNNIVPSLLPACWRSVKHSDLISASFVLRPNNESTLKENLGCIFIVSEGAVRGGLRHMSPLRQRLTLR